MIPVYRCGEGEAQTFSIMHINNGAGLFVPAIAFDWKMGEKARSIAINEEQSPTLSTQADRYAVMTASAVRRLTPTECERLQGFPDGYTLIPYRGKPAADGPRYKALGNSMAVPVMRWIGERIQIVDKLP